MTETTEPRKVAQAFFDNYTQALMTRDASAIADHYAVPVLIEFPDSVMAVTDRAETEQFFSRAMDQYAQVTSADASVVVAASGPHSVWADVTWDYHGDAPAERNMYQLTQHDGSWRIAVLTPLSLG